MTLSGADTVVVRYAEIGTKSRQVRGWMERQLVENIEALLADRDVEGTVTRPEGRILIETSEADVDAAAAAAADAFGVSSTSPAVTVAPTMEAITEALAEAGRQVYTEGSFAVDANRAGTAFEFTSEDLEQAGGTAVWEAVDDRFTPEVDLENPDYTFEVDCREDTAYVFVHRYDGPGGLPLGSQNPMVALLSGGIDSPVAAHEVMKRGSPVIPLYLDLGDYGGPDHRARVMEVARTLSRFAPNFDTRLRVAPAGDALDDIVQAMERGRMLSVRRFMYRVAEHIAEEEGAVGLVTGEAIGQKSSQTAPNLRITSAATDLPIHRPLLTMNKNDIVERAKAIDTFTDSTIPTGCHQFVPPRPETNGNLAKLEQVEPDDIFEWAEAVAGEVEVVDPAATDVL